MNPCTGMKESCLVQGAFCCFDNFQENSAMESKNARVQLAFSLTNLFPNSRFRGRFDMSTEGRLEHGNFVVGPTGYEVFLARDDVRTCPEALLQTQE